MTRAGGGTKPPTLLAETRLQHASGKPDDRCRATYGAAAPYMLMRPTLSLVGTIGEQSQRSEDWKTVEVPWLIGNVH